MSPNLHEVYSLLLAMCGIHESFRLRQMLPGLLYCLPWLCVLVWAWVMLFERMNEQKLIASMTDDRNKWDIRYLSNKKALQLYNDMETVRDYSSSVNIY